MAYRLRMSAELSDWLAELCAAGPGSPEWLAATEAGAAIAAVMSATDPVDLALVTDLAASAAITSPDDQLVEVDYAYQQLLEGLRPLRIQAAEAGSFRHTTRQRITPAGSCPLPFTADEITAATTRERTLIERMQRNQAAIDRFRSGKEVAKARYTAARAARDVHHALLASAAESGASHELDQARAELSRVEAGLAAASAQLAAALADAARLSRRLAREAQAAANDDASGSGDPRAAAAPLTDKGDEDQVTAGLLELRFDPLGADIRILLAIEPADTATLLAVLDGSAAVSEHRHQAIKLAGELLAELRATGWPQDQGGADGPGSSDSSELTFADAGAFLATYFPGSAAGVKRRSAALATASTLAALRRQHRASLDELAERTGLSATALRRLEDDDLGSAELADIAAYVRALGGRLRVTAEFDGEQQVLL
jgi:hypothetical protein